MAGTVFRTSWRRSRQPVFLRQALQVLRKTMVDDGAGGQTEVENVLATVTGSIQTRDVAGVTGRETVEAGRLVASTLFYAVLPVGTDCGPADVLFNPGENLRYEVMDSDAGRAEARNLTLNLRRVR